MEKVSTGKIGRYEIIRVLGRGGMGEVILAQDENLGRRVAIKRPFKSAVADGLARFQVEAKAATLRHPNIPAVYEMGVHDDLPFIAMEYVEGETLEKMIESKRDVDLITKLRIIEQVCSALGYAHENGIIHRDIKPANIIVQPDGTAKIIDFGIAKLQDDDPNSGLTKASQLIGSLHYIAPERFYGGKVDGRADLFSVGVTLFKFLTGKEPFTGGEATASFKIMNETHTGLSAYLHDYPPVLDEIVEKSLAKNPDDRYQTGEDFADALHEVTEELKRTRVTELFGDAERLTTERRFAPALELLDEAIRLDPSHTQARKLRKFVREHQERIRRAERLRECLLKSDEALLSGNFEEALNQLKDAQNLDQASEEIKSKIQAVEDKKRRFESSARALADAERVKARGDITGALRIVTRALEEDPEHKKLLSLNAALQRQMEIEAQRGRLLELQENATRALAVRDYDSAEKLLNEAAAIDPANADTDKLRRELSHARELEQRRAVLEEIQVRVHEFIRTDNYDQASDLLTRALDRLPNETLLHRLKAEVDAEARKFDVRRIVDMTIAQANELFATSPFEALSVVQKALETIPGEERLIGYERSLRQQLDARRSEQLRADTVLKARELMDAGQFEKAIGVLETFQVEAGQHPDVDALLTFARDEFARRQRAEMVGRSLSDARNLVRDGRLDEAAAILEKAHQQTSDASIGTLLDEVRQQQATIARKLEALLKRVDLLRARGELDEAIQSLQEQLTVTPGNANLQQLLNSLVAERKQKQTTAIALRAAREALRQNDFAAALESLHTVVNAYGETPEVASAIKDVERQRSNHAGETVARSIESAQAALLKKDPAGALEALKIATPFLEHADAQKQAEWQRIGQAVKKALQQAGSTTGGHAVFDKQLTAIAQTKPRKTMLWAGIGGAVVVAAGITTVVLLNKPKTQIQIPKLVPATARVEIDKVEQKPRPDGSIIVAVQPGTHDIRITADNCEPLTDSVPVQSGSILNYPVKLSCRQPGQVASQGTLLVVTPTDLPKVRVFVDGESKGIRSNGDTMMLEAGDHHVVYRWDGYQDSNDHLVSIAKGSTVSDRVAMEKTPTRAGTLVIHLQPGLSNVRMLVNNTPRGEVHEGQQITLAENSYSLQFESVGYSPQVISGYKVVAGDRKQIDVNLVKTLQPSGSLTATPDSILKGEAATIAWKTQNAPNAQIQGIGVLPNSDGSKTVALQATTTFTLLSADGKELNHVTVTVRERPRLTQFDANPPAIDAGASSRLSWKVENADSIQISGIGVEPAQGTFTVSPQENTRYELSVNGIKLGDVTVNVRQKSTPQPPPNPTPGTNAPAGPDQATLQSALNASYVAVFQRAGGKNKQECKAAFTGAFGGRLNNDWGDWCGRARSFSIQEKQCLKSGDTALTCQESITVVPNNGDPQPFPARTKTFTFRQGADGNWQVSTWQ